MRRVAVIARGVQLRADNTNEQADTTDLVRSTFHSSVFSPTNPAVVFVSHSSKTSESIGVRDAIMARLTAAADVHGGRLFEPWIDRDKMARGESWWRNIVNVCITQCHSAIVLISDDAVRSPYVAYEICTLIERKQLYPDFCLIAVTLPGLAAGADCEALFAGLRAVDVEPNALPTFAEADLQAALAQIGSQLERAPATAMPVDPACDYIVQILARVPEHVLHGVSEALEIALPVFLGPSDIRTRLATSLMSVGERANNLILKLSRYLNAEDSADILRVIASAWANPFFANRISNAIANNAHLLGLRVPARLLSLYLVRAFGIGSPNLTIVDEPCVADEEEVITSIRRALRDNIGLDDDWNMTEVLLLQSKHRSVFVAIQAGAMTRSLVQRLRTELPTVIFLVSFGHDEDEAALRDSGVEIVASTSDEDERRFSLTYIRGLRLLEAERP